MPSLAEAQLELIRRTAALEPQPWLMGGYAEDALLARAVTRPHEDLDWLFPRSELDLRLAQAAQLGFDAFETWGEAAPGEPFYLFGQAGELKLDLGITDEAEGRPVVRVHRLSFTVGGREAPAGYRFSLPPDTFGHHAAELEGISLRTVSPLALIRLRLGFAARGSFGPLSDAQREATRRLAERFFPGRSEESLVPRVEPLG